jgi:hypothetical protein
LRQIMDQNTPGPRLLLGSEAVAPSSDLPSSDPGGATAEPSV